jgi:cholera toxin transcriptional activator
VGDAFPICGSVRFGVFEADPLSGELHRQGLKIHLPEQAFRVLVLLLRSPGMLVTREELRTNLWETDTFVDFDHGLNTAIYKIRRALGDSARSPRFVETVSRRGFRFLSPVEVLATGTPLEPTSLALFEWNDFWQGLLGESNKPAGAK